jgi:hypothetical protein
VKKRTGMNRRPISASTTWPKSPKAIPDTSTNRSSGAIGVTFSIAPTVGNAIGSVADSRMPVAGLRMVASTTTPFSSSSGPILKIPGTATNCHVQPMRP